jgi:hypothetical protein
MFKSLKDMQYVLDEIKFLDRLFSDINEDERDRKVEKEVFDRLDKCFLHFDYSFDDWEQEDVYKAMATILDRADVPNLYRIAVLFLFFLQRQDLGMHFRHYIERKYKI